MMFMRIVQQVNGLVTALSTRASSLVKERLLPPVNKLRVSITLASLSVVNLLSQLVKTALNIKALLVSLITQVQSIKAVLITAKAKVLQLGQQLLTIVRPTSQPAPTLPSLKTAKPAGSTKSAQSRSKGSKTAQIRTVPQSIQAGTKLDGLVKQHLQHAKQASKKGK